MNYRDQRYSIILFSWVVEGNHYLALAPSQRNIIIMYYSVINMYHRKDSHPGIYESSIKKNIFHNGIGNH